jgi:preprotein translocase subunit SecE
MIQRVKNFLGEVKTETKKVNYPSKDELIGSTWVVIITVILIGVFLGLIDFGLSRALKVIIR